MTLSDVNLLYLPITLLVIVPIFFFILKSKLKKWNTSEQYQLNKKEKLNIFLIIISIIVLIVIFTSILGTVKRGVYYYSYIVSPIVDLTHSTKVCEILLPYKNTHKNTCIDQSTSRFANPDYCNSLGEEVDKDNCFNALALKQKNHKVCEKITDDWTRGNCIKSIAVEERGLALCEEINVEKIKNSCFSNIAIKLKDSVICEKIKDEGEFGSCLCELKTGIDKDNCYYDLAKKVDNKFYCRLMDLNENICSSDLTIPDFADINYCNSQGNDKDSCFIVLAMRKKNHELCREINSEYRKNRCFESLAIRLKDSTICEKIDNRDFFGSCLCKSKDMVKDDCMNYKAILLGDVRLCDSIFNLAKRTSCFDHFNK